MIETYFPPAANIGTVLIAFVILLAVAHLLVWPKNLSKKTWKYVDYVWLAFAAIGLVGASANVRMHTAEKELTHAEKRVVTFYWFISISLGIIRARSWGCLSGIREI